MPTFSGGLEILPPKDQELEFGNYLLVSWDGLFHNGHLLQLGAYLTNLGKSWIQNIKPDLFCDVLNEDLSKRLTYTKHNVNVSLDTYLGRFM